MCTGRVSPRNSALGHYHGLFSMPSKSRESASNYTIMHVYTMHKHTCTWVCYALPMFLLFRRIPKKDWNTKHLLEISRIMIAHSIVQGGPTFSCLCPAVYSYMVYGSKDKALEELPSAEDIPRNAATSGICSLIEKVRKLV